MSVYPQHRPRNELRQATSDEDDFPSKKPPKPSLISVASVPDHKQPPKRSVQSLAPNVSVVLENSGTVARDHLANERTWLAYVRTSLAISGTGVALVQLFTLSGKNGSPGNATTLNLARPLGAATVLVGLGVLAVGVWRFFRIQKAMILGQYPTARSVAVLITAVLASLVAVTFGIVVTLPV